VLADAFESNLELPVPVEMDHRAAALEFRQHLEDPVSTPVTRDATTEPARGCPMRMISSGRGATAT